MRERGYVELVKALRGCFSELLCPDCYLWENGSCKWQMRNDAADAIEELLAFAKFVARQAIDTGDNDGVSAEILCRKLNKLGLIETDGEFWMLPTPPKGGNHDN